MPIAIRRPLLSSCAASCPRTHPPYVKRFAAICPAKSRLVRELLHKVIESLLTLDPGNSEYVSLHAAACVGLGRHDTAIAAYRQLLASSPDSSDFHVALGHT